MACRFRACLTSAVLIAAFCAAGLARAQSETLRERLAHATRLDCRFGAVVTGTWEDGTARATVATTEFAASFSAINVEQGTAEADGRLGSSYIVVRYAEDSLHLMQMIDIGPLYITTVWAREVREGRLMAVQTRLEFAASKYPDFRERPEMYIGDCAVESADPSH